MKKRIFYFEHRQQNDAANLLRDVVNWMNDRDESNNINRSPEQLINAYLDYYFKLYNS